MSRPAHHHADQAAEACPYCGQEITREELLTIEARLEKEQLAKFDAMTKRLNAKHLAEVSDLRKAQAEKERSAQERLKSIEERHRVDLKNRDQATEKQVAKALKTARTEWESETRKEREQTERSKRALAKERRTFEAEKETIQKTHEQAMQRQRDSLAADHEKKLMAQKAASDKETFRTQRKVEDLQRQLEKKSNDELGDGAEIDLYNDLKRAFPDDVIRRVKRGVAGADIKHEIHVEGRLCGKIVYDSKNRGDWKMAYAEQLRKDQMAEKADYAILGTRKFPRNTREMTIRNGVILVNPGRATVIAGLLRNALVQLSSVKLSETGKHEKRRALYDYVTSTRCATLFTRVEDQVANLRGLDEQERTQQERMRNNRAKHVGEIEKAVIGELQREIHKILGL
jgi:hypothetical protein